MNYCINCKHAFHKIGNPYTLYCKNTEEIDPVYGSASYNLCKIERGFITEISCGKDGKFFVEKEK